MDTEAPSTVWLLWTLLLETSKCRCTGISLHLYLWGKSPVQLLGCRAGPFLTLWGTSTQFSRVAGWLHHFTFPPTVQEGSPFSTSSPTFVVSCLVNFPHSYWCEVVSHRGFDLYFPDGKWCRAFSPVRVGHVYVFLCEISDHVFCPFHDWIVCFFAVEFNKFFIDIGN